MLRGVCSDVEGVYSDMKWTVKKGESNDVKRMCSDGY